MHATPPTASSARAKAGAVFRVTSGNFLEQFDFFLFGFYATYIAAAFFPASSEFASLMMTFAVFGAGFLMRPLGAVILGAYIDEVGRRKGLIVTLSWYRATKASACWLRRWFCWGACCRASPPVRNWVGSRSIWRKSPHRAARVSTWPGTMDGSRYRCRLGLAHSIHDRLPDRALHFLPASQPGGN